MQHGIVGGELLYLSKRVESLTIVTNVSIVEPKYFLQLFSHLIRILIKACPLKKVVLLGDVNQLPSIAPGNFMSDLFRSLMAESFVVQLTTNHRSESSLIFENAERICRGKMPLFDR